MPRLQIPSARTTEEKEDEMSEMSFEEAAHELMHAFASGESISHSTARYSGYDVHALQYCMDMIEQELESLPGYKPLVLWIRQSERNTVTSEDDIHCHKHVLRIEELYVVGSKEDNWRVQYVGVYVTREGKYFVAITELPEALRGTDYPKELEARLYPCETALALAEVLNPLLVQFDRYGRYDDRFRILSPLTFITEKLIHLCKSQLASAKAQSNVLEELAEQMSASMKT